MENRLTSCRWMEVDFPLKTPYHLSFATLESFCSLQVELSFDDQSQTLAEVVPLPGYSAETRESIIAFFEECCLQAEGMTSDELRQKILQGRAENNFSRTAFLTAIDLQHFSLGAQDHLLAHPTIIPLTAERPDHLVSALLKAPLSTCFKVKLTGDVVIDTEAIHRIDALNRSDLRLRFDANQAYALADAQVVSKQLLEMRCYDQVDYLEQPLNRNDWEGQRTLSETFPSMRFMLDEGVYSEKEIDLAVEIGVEFVKLKLFKQGGIKELIDQSRYAFEQGLKVVIGNGVATWLSNAIEISVYDAHREWFYGAHEANGYLKT